MIRRILDLLGSARAENDSITSDAMTIAALRLENTRLKTNCNVWQAKAEHYKDKLADAQPFIIAGQKRKAADRRGAERRRG